MLTNSRLGVYILLDYFGDDDSGIVTDPASGPLELSEFTTAVAAYALPPQIDQPSGMTYLEADRAFAIVTDQAELFVVSDDFTTGRLVRELAFEDDLRGRLKPGRSLSEYQLSGLDYADGRLFAVSETFNTLFIIDPEHGLVRTLGIENGGQISAIAVRDRTAYLPLDHNYVDERPALLTVTLD